MILRRNHQTGTLRIGRVGIDKLQFLELDVCFRALAFIATVGVGCFAGGGRRVKDGAGA